MTKHVKIEWKDLIKIRRDISNYCDYISRYNIPTSIFPAYNIAAKRLNLISVIRNTKMWYAAYLKVDRKLRFRLTHNILLDYETAYDICNRRGFKPRFSYLAVWNSLFLKYFIPTIQVIVTRRYFEDYYVQVLCEKKNITYFMIWNPIKWARSYIRGCWQTKLDNYIETL